ncbi:MAG: hypothetical protein OEY18_06480 [Candidatus Aminicenantes bacterium]|nr:hypothetical protein [Candidatus Aminicenantes bacterium]MDH5384338.1 hypothetical protein [Candidatus Aminicenantes bacterium]MDH5744417.1 hypothetical protein [Candidatus Aminicenantes bacterium]
MNDQRPGMFVPALIGGAVAGILSGIPFVNCLCCLWIIGGAMLAAYLLTKDSPVALSAGDGAIVGIFTGIVAAFVEVIISIPFKAVTDKFMRNMIDRFSEYYDEIPQGLDSWFEGGAFDASFVWIIIGLVISAVIFAALGALGGIIGISLFRKKTTQRIQGAVDVPKDSGDRQP